MKTPLRYLFSQRGGNMRLSGIEITVGDPFEKLPIRRNLEYLVSFKNDVGEECRLKKETLVLEQALNDVQGIARIVALFVLGLMIEDADPGAVRRPVPQAM
jgi:hypothetical protein